MGNQDWENDIKNSQKSQAPFWNPKEGEYLLGKVLDLREISTKYGLANIMELDTKNGVETILLRTVLGREIQRLKVRIGDTIGVKYCGKIKNYHNYLVKLYQRGDEEVPF